MSHTFSFCLHFDPSFDFGQNLTPTLLSRSHSDDTAWGDLHILTYWLSSEEDSPTSTPLLSMLASRDSSSSDFTSVKMNP